MILLCSKFLCNLIPSVEIHPRSESSQERLNPTEDMDGEIPSKEDSDSGSGSESDSESCSDSGSQDASFSDWETASEESPVHFFYYY